MNNFERFASTLGFDGVRLLKNSKKDVAILEFKSCDYVRTRLVLGAPDLHQTNYFFFIFTRERALRIDFSKNRLVLVNSRRALLALRSTMKKDTK